jgi:RNA polymerase sigma-70 factor (ECF subfamily)
MRSDPERQGRFVDLVRSHQGAIRKVAALYAKDSADRDDLFQEITLQLWRSFDSFRGDSAFSTFLFRVALNTALMRLRHAYRRPEIESGRTVDDVAAPARPRNDEDVERLYEAVRQLGPVDRAIVLLLLEERSYDEIAAVTGLSAGNVSVRLVRCKERLRRLMGAGERQKEGTPCSTKR